jgi:hypothetical protein
MPILLLFCSALNAVQQCTIQVYTNFNCGTAFDTAVHNYAMSGLPTRCLHLLHLESPWDSMFPNVQLNCDGSPVGWTHTQYVWYLLTCMLTCRRQCHICLWYMIMTHICIKKNKVCFVYGIRHLLIHSIESRTYYRGFNVTKIWDIDQSNCSNNHRCVRISRTCKWHTCVYHTDLQYVSHDPLCCIYHVWHLLTCMQWSRIGDNYM